MALAINPIPWTLTEAEVPREDNAGSIRPITIALSDSTLGKDLASAQVNTTRGVVVWKSVDVSKVNKNRARGVEVKIISKLLGHASVEIACNRYIHFFGGDIGDTLRQAVGA
ncbi:MAG: hypothetical protein VB115_10155 [Christensenellaceae bacterium]|nr:hypothetical protein [Christensenellaceae bacterium]